MLNVTLSLNDYTKLRRDTLENFLLGNIEETNCSRTLRSAGSRGKMYKVDKEKKI